VSGDRDSLIVRGDFCTVRCFRLGLKVFSKLLRDGRFGALLQQVIAEEMKKAA
jgi:hypothetical protein